ncbi:16S rRNA (guanine(527)-N(7))-methyltransferase RsmG [Rickettsiales bacterium LUAb2]
MINNDKLIEYQNMLILWQKKMNLIADNDKNNIWERHILDCIQIQKYIIGENKTIIDLGSGAGLPGIILAINDPNNNYILIEANTKKTIFLQAVKQKLQLINVNIINDRIENIIENLRADYIVSRALTSFLNLLKYSENLLKNDGLAIFLKGINFDLELKEAKQDNILKQFTHRVVNNDKGNIILVNKVKL